MELSGIAKEKPREELEQWHGFDKECNGEAKERWPLTSIGEAKKGKANG